jgi:hypothetical protein
MKIAMKRSAQVAALTLMCLAMMAVGSCNKAHTAANAVNKYAEALSHFQDAEIKAHNAGRVDDATHRKILEAEKAAAVSGKNLDAAILIANQGGDASSFIDLADKGFTDLVAVIDAKDPQTQQELSTLANLAGALLKNAIVLIHQIKPSATPAPVTPAPGLAFTFLIAGAAIAGATGSLAGILALLNLVATFEPIALDLVLKFAQSLKGKTTEEIVAMNEQLFGKVIATADAELEKT